ncbi:hypothetical protein HMPREF1981_01760 [Bacteroides pyogenes F0041]|uniref:Uncharacterized protein n=1 Tax=Bacteroides pyogenes F0041 TaxID=1321819 RepID=U2DZM6_9BACE|nr:hypothetical protein HMPREF1981_01760 [Bacteroides pyogenes F0041]
MATMEIDMTNIDMLINAFFIIRCFYNRCYLKKLLLFIGGYLSFIDMQR